MKKVVLSLTILVQVWVVYSQTHFVKGSISPGVDQMNLRIVNADIGGVPLQAGDEIAVFDGNLCCGVVLLTQAINISNPLTFALLDASADDGSSNGFIPFHKMYFRFWDSSAGIEYHNIIPIVKDNTNTTIANEFKIGETIFIIASTANTTKTYLGDLAEDNTWTNSLNWDPEGVPEPLNDVVIPSGYSLNISTNMASCGNLSFDNNLTVSSGSSATGSLIINGNLNGAGTILARRYLIANGWHLVASPISGQTISNFLSSSANNTIPTKDVTSRGMTDYNESSDNWNSYFTNSTIGNIELGKGYIARSSGNTTITFSGPIVSGNVLMPITKDNNGWNLLGNPFTSAIYVQQEVFGFLTENEDMLDPSYKALYIWDPTTSNYTVINSGEGQANLASGQGFFIKAALAGNVTFTKQMQVHQTDASFKSGKIKWPSIVLNAKVDNISSSTKISFNEKMTLGLDQGYDAGILRSGNGFDIYSRLVSDNGVDFAIQSLPGKSTDSYIVPIGVDATKNGEIVFSADAMNLPLGYELMIEDKLTKTITNLKNGEIYVTNLASGTKGVGRFYLHLGSSIQTGIQEIQRDQLVVYTIDQTLYIKGNVSNNAQFMVYSIDGRLINRFGATTQNLNQMNIAGFTPGIYFVNVQDKSKYKPVKFVVGK